MIISGLTGGIATGKTTIASIFKEHNIPVVDADEIAHQVVAVGSEGLQDLINKFGKDYLNVDGSLNRSKLGELVFNNKKKLDDLNIIMKPLMALEQKKQFSLLKKRGFKLIIFDAPLIIESGLADKYRPLIVIQCPLEVQLERLMLRNAISKEQAMVRIKAQLPMEVKVKLADFIIDTSNDLNVCRKQIKKIIRNFNKLTLN